MSIIHLFTLLLFTAPSPGLELPRISPSAPVGALDLGPVLLAEHPSNQALLAEADRLGADVLVYQSQTIADFYPAPNVGKEVAGCKGRLALGSRSRKSEGVVKLEFSQALFARHYPYGDQRVVSVRRGDQMGFDYGLEFGRRALNVDGTPVTLVSYHQLLSPPPLVPRQQPMSQAAAAHYTPESEVAYIAGMEVLLRRHPSGFTEEEVVELVNAFYRSTQQPLSIEQEERFAFIHHACTAGIVPALHAGDIIYIETHSYFRRGANDYVGGLAMVHAARNDTSAGEPQPYVSVVNDPAVWHLWPALAAQQTKLAQLHGRSWAHAQPDNTPLFNERWPLPQR